MVLCEYCILVIFSNYFTVKRGNLAYFSSFLSLLKSNLKKSLICSTHMGPFWIAILILHTKSFQKIFTFLECLIFCLNQTLAGCDWFRYKLCQKLQMKMIPQSIISFLQILHLNFVFLKMYIIQMMSLIGSYAWILVYFINILYFQFISFDKLFLLRLIFFHFFMNSCNRVYVSSHQWGS